MATSMPNNTSFFRTNLNRYVGLWFSPFLKIEFAQGAPEDFSAVYFTSMQFWLDDGDHQQGDEDEQRQIMQQPTGYDSLRLMHELFNLARWLRDNDSSMSPNNKPKELKDLAFGGAQRRPKARVTEIIDTCPF